MPSLSRMSLICNRMLCRQLNCFMGLQLCCMYLPCMYHLQTDTELSCSNLYAQSSPFPCWMSFSSFMHGKRDE
jgi:hypothetical protein